MENQNSESVKSFFIPETRMEEFRGKLAELNKKAVKVNSPAITFKVIREFDQSYAEHPITGKLLVFPLVIHFYQVVLDGIEPKFNGWSFIARIDHMENGNIINSLPGIELDKRYRELGNLCEHCGINRYRKSTFIVRHENGQEKQVGSACLKDFVGHGSPEKIAAFCESIFGLIKEMRENEYMFGGNRNRFGIASILSVSSAVIRRFGWISATKSRETGETASVHYVLEYLFESKELVKEIGELSADDISLAGKSLEWIRNRPENPADKGDYFFNLKTLCKGDSADVKHAGILVSLIPVYRRELEKIEVKKAEIGKPISQWIGHPDDKKRIKLSNVKVVGYKPLDTDFGVSHMYHFIAQSAEPNTIHKLTWFSSRNMGLNEGDVINIAFSVKKLNEYKGEHQTIITRAKIS